MSRQQAALELLLHCLSDRRAPVDRTDSPGLWSEAARLAAGYDLAPLLYAHLRRSGARGSVPSDTWEQLRLAYFSSASRNLRLYNGLRSVLGRLRGADVAVLVLKGAFLAEVVYGDVAVRPMGDIDLMVRKAELPRVQAILLGMGGAARHTTDIEWSCRTGSHLPPVAIRGLVIEVHWTIVAPTRQLSIDVDGLWNRAGPTSIAGTDAFALAPEDLLIHLCLSASLRDGLMGGLRSFSDIAETARHWRHRLDWGRVAESAQEWGGARHVYLALRLAQDMLKAEVPDHVLGRLVPGGPGPGVLEAARQSVLTRRGYDRMIPLSYKHLGAETAGEKAALIWSRVFLSRDAMAARYPDSRGKKHLSFYYFLRLRDVVRTYWLHLLARARTATRNLGSTRQDTLADWLRAGKS